MLLNYWNTLNVKKSLKSKDMLPDLWNPTKGYKILKFISDTIEYLKTNKMLTNTYQLLNYV